MMCIIIESQLLVLHFKPLNFLLEFSDFFVIRDFSAREASGATKNGSSHCGASNGSLTFLGDCASAGLSTEVNLGLTLLLVNEGSDGLVCDKGSGKDC